MNVEDNSEEVLNNEYVETTENTPDATNIKEEEQDTKTVLDSIHPITNGVQVREEIVENGNKLIPTSVILLTNY